MHHQVPLPTPVSKYRHMLQNPEGPKHMMKSQLVPSWPEFSCSGGSAGCLHRCRCDRRGACSQPLVVHDAWGCMSWRNSTLLLPLGLLYRFLCVCVCLSTHMLCCSALDRTEPSPTPEVTFCYSRQFDSGCPIPCLDVCRQVLGQRSQTFYFFLAVLKQFYCFSFRGWQGGRRYNSHVQLTVVGQMQG